MLREMRERLKTGILFNNMTMIVVKGMGVGGWVWGKQYISKEWYSIEWSDNDSVMDKKSKLQ